MKEIKKIISLSIAFIMLLVTCFPIPTNAYVNMVTSSESAVLDFTPADVVKDESNTILYMTDFQNKRVVAYNYATKESKFIQLQFPAEHLTFANGELYITILKTGHDSYNKDAQEGAIGIIDPSTFNTASPSLEEQIDIDLDPYGIAVDKDGYIYVSGGSAQWTELRGYDRKTKQKLSSTAIHEKEPIKLNSFTNRIYAEGNFSPFTVSVFQFNKGIVQAGNDFRDESRNWIGDIFQLSPDGNYLITQDTYVYNCGSKTGSDMLLKTNLGSSVQDIAFNLNQNVFYSAVGNSINVYSYNNFLYQNSYYTTSTINRIFVDNDKIIAITKDNDGKYYVETLTHAKEALKPAFLFSSIENNTINVPLIKQIILTYDSNVTISDPSLISLIDSNNKKINVDVSAQDNLIKLSLRDNLEYATEYTLNIGGCANNNINSANNFEGKIINFVTCAESTSEDNKITNYIVNKVISDDITIDGDLVVDTDCTLNIKNGATFNVNGNVIIYGNIVNEGALNVTKNVFAKKSGEEKNYDKWSYYGNYSKIGTDNIAGGVSSDYPSPIVYLDKNSDFSSASMKTNFYFIHLPHTRISINNQECTNGINGFCGHADYQLNLGTNPVDIKIMNEFDDTYHTNLNINCTAAPLAAPEIIPSDIETVPMPVNFYCLLKFAVPIKQGSGKIQIEERDTNSAYCANSEILQDTDGNNTLLLVEYQNDLSYESDFTLDVSSDAVTDLSGAPMAEDYKINFSTDKEFKRLAGDDRYHTAIEISKEGWENSDTIVIATGEKFPDALCAAPLANKYNAPILLTNSNKLNSGVIAEIRRLSAKKAYIVGGTGAVSQGVENALNDMGIYCERISGKDRYETSAAIAEHLENNHEVIIATGNNFPDALSIASYAAYSQTPILLTDNSRMPDSVRRYINNYSINHTIIVGGTGVISKALENTLPDPVRYAGRDRYETNYEIICSTDVNPTYTFFATGKNFPDALSGSALASYLNSPIVLVDKDMNQDVLETWKYNKEVFKMKYILGGTGAVPDSLINYMFK